MILARGANHDLVDSNGNSVTHILVVFDNMRMFDLAVECGASINIKNKGPCTNDIHKIFLFLEPPLLVHICH